MNAIRESARAVRQRIEAGERLSWDEAVAACVTFDEAMSVFSGEPEEDDAGTHPVCCGARVAVKSGFLYGQEARCESCGAEFVDALGPMTSPLLRRGNSFVTVPSEKMIEELGDRWWLVTHEGDRA